MPSKDVQVRCYTSSICMCFGLDAVMFKFSRIVGC